MSQRPPYRMSDDADPSPDVSEKVVTEHQAKVLAADAEVESALLALDAATERYRDALDARVAIERKNPW